MNIVDTVPEVLDRCAVGFVPVNLDILLAIEAHQQSPSANTLRVVILACQPAVADTQRQLDYLTELPDSKWEAVPDWGNTGTTHWRRSDAALHGGQSAPDPSLAHRLRGMRRRLNASIC